MENVSKMAGGEQLGKWGDFVIIDNLARTYPQYTHDDIFNLDVEFVHELIIYNATREYIQTRSTEVHRQIQQSKK